MWKKAKGDLVYFRHEIAFLICSGVLILFLISKTM